MPVLSSLLVQNIRDTPYTKTRVPFYPNDEFAYSRGYINTRSQAIIWHGFLSGAGSDTYTSVYPYGIDSFGVYGMGQTSTFLDDVQVITATCYKTLYASRSIRVNVYFRLDQTANFRFWIGFSNTLDGGDITFDNDDCLPNYHGFGLRVGMNGNFKIISNNGSASSNISSDIKSIDTNIHNIYLEADPLNSRWGYSIDNSNTTYIMTQIPSFSESFSVHSHIMNKESGVGKSYKLYDILAAQKVRGS